MTTPRSPLGLMLIISAIDVLLCSFTAALVLFFVGAGSGASGFSKQYAGIAANSGSDVQGKGAPAAFLVFTYGSPSSRVTPDASWTIDRIPASNGELAANETWLLFEAPSNTRPLTFRTPTGSDPLDATLTFVVSGEALTVALSCAGTSPAEFTLRGPPFSVVPRNPCKVSDGKISLPQERLRWPSLGNLWERLRPFR